MGLAGLTVTPGTYRVKVKGKVENNTIVLEVVRSPLDYLERFEHNKMYLISLNPALPIPVIKTFTFPIAKARIPIVVGLGENKILPLTQTND